MALMPLALSPTDLPQRLRNVVRRTGVRLTTELLCVNIRTQRMVHFHRAISYSDNGREPARARYHVYRIYVISTSRFGVGQREGSNRTPLGLHRVAEKIGAGWPVGTIFRSRQPMGFTWKPADEQSAARTRTGTPSPGWRGCPGATITTRILWLDGLEPGFNRGGDVDSHARYIYIHGTGDETTLGRPASCGCIHMRSTDLMPLFDSIASGTLVWIGQGG